MQFDACFHFRDSLFYFIVTYGQALYTCTLIGVVWISFMFNKVWQKYSCS